MFLEQLASEVVYVLIFINGSLNYIFLLQGFSAVWDYGQLHPPSEKMLKAILAEINYVISPTDAPVQISKNIIHTLVMERQSE